MPPSSPLRDKTYDFAVCIVKFCQQLQQKKEYVLSKQLLKSGTSIGSNVEEAVRAQSKPDFISKLSISLKEASETDFWLRLIIDCDLDEENKAQALRKALDEILRMLVASVKTSRNSLT